MSNVAEVFYEVCPFITSKLDQAFAIQRTEYWVSDGCTRSSEVVDVASSRAEADALLGHYRVAA